MSELQGLQLHMEEFRRRGCRVVGVTADPADATASLARAAHLDFPLLSDPDLRAIDAYGLRHRGGAQGGRDIALSASILIDGAGVVRWTHVTPNFRVRPLPRDILVVVDGLGG